MSDNESNVGALGTIFMVILAIPVIILAVIWKLGDLSE